MQDISIDALAAAYDKYAEQMDETLAEVSAFLQQGRGEAAELAAFEASEAAAQTEPVSDSITTVQDIAQTAARSRAASAQSARERAASAYDAVENELQADAEKYKADALLQTEKNAARSYLPDFNTDEYDRAADARAFARKVAQNAYARLLADNKYALSAQKNAMQREKFEFSKKGKKK